MTFTHLKDDLDAPDLPWPIEPKDKDPMSEHQRQSRVVNKLRKLGVIVFAANNGGKQSDALKLWLQAEGVTAGAPDLVAFWKGGRCACIEMKNGTGAPSRQQRAMLNALYRAGVPCGVFRTAAGVVAFLRGLGVGR